MHDSSAVAYNPPNLAVSLDVLRQSNVPVVLDQDRLGRRAGVLITLIDNLDHRAVRFRARNSPMAAAAPAARALL